MPHESFVYENSALPAISAIAHTTNKRKKGERTLSFFLFFIFKKKKRKTNKEK